MPKAIKLSIIGRVQGVGFRPFIFQLANKFSLKGTVQNNMDGVKIHIEGEEANLEFFLLALGQEKPFLARIDDVKILNANVKDYDAFSIIGSDREGDSQLVIPIDAAVCDQCLLEMNNQSDRRYKYPFINCTQCGPRYTIIDELPYDRPFTSMANFSLCSDCEVEYNDPLNRRHHAQPIACEVCGPKVVLINQEGSEVVSENHIAVAAELLFQGNIIAVKGLGGYHLCCDARNEEAVERLRRRKNRPNRPLAVMSSTIEEIKKFAAVSKREEQLLQSPEAPIVVLKKQNSYDLAQAVAPKMTTIGAMLPYTPIHHLLLQEGELHTLVMTSANLSGLPIIHDDKQCTKYLFDIADYFLLHNRPILHPVDDSVVQINQNQTDFFRKSRGYVPDPIQSTSNVDRIIALGGQQKSTFAIGRNQQIFIGPHIGDLENIETTGHYQKELDHLLKWMNPPQKTAVIDFHPSYQVRRLVHEYAFEEILEVQHHHAHMAACITDNQIEGKTFAIILDGTGYGLDGNIWGFEILYGDCGKFERLAHLTYTPLPGGEKCIREPWRNSAAMLMYLLGEEGKYLCEQIFPKQASALPVLQAMIERNINTVYAGTCGRLFDAVSALIGVCEKSTYDGEAAIQLSELAELQFETEPYTYLICKQENELVFDFTRMLSEIIVDVQQNKDVRSISTAFHETVVVAIVEAMTTLINMYPGYENRIVLSGGSFHNRFLREKLTSRLSELDFSVYGHRNIPCNDGGLSFGQLMVAAAKREE